MTGLAFVTFMLIFIDQLFKTWAYNATASGSWQIIPKVFYITYVENTGAAFNMFAGSRWILVGVTSVILLAIAFLIFTKKVTSDWLVSGLCLALAGGASNLIDRVLHGYVVDCLQILSFPVFNIADCCVCLGTAMLLYYFLVVEPKEKKAKAAKAIEATASPTTNAQIVEAKNEIPQTETEPQTEEVTPVSEMPEGDK